jgi:hypothetical protein
MSAFGRVIADWFRPKAAFQAFPRPVLRFNHAGAEPTPSSLWPLGASEVAASVPIRMAERCARPPAQVFAGDVAFSLAINTVVDRGEYLLLVGHPS